MLKISYLFAIIFLLISSQPPVAIAQEAKEIESITILSDPHLVTPLSELASAFVPQNTISVSSIFGNSAEQKKKIEDGDSGDIFITSDKAFIQELRVKGLVDIYSITDLVSEDNKEYTAAVIAGENMTPARKFLEYMKSDQAKKIWDKNGFEVPE